MVILNKAKLLEHETVFFYASEMDTNMLCNGSGRNTAYRNAGSQTVR